MRPTYGIADRFHELPVWAQLCVMVLASIVVGGMALVVARTPGDSDSKTTSAQWERYQAECEASMSSDVVYARGDSYSEALLGCMVAKAVDATP